MFDNERARLAKFINLVSAVYKNLQENKYKFVSLEDLIKYNEGLLILYDNVDANIPLYKDSILLLAKS